MSESDLQTDVLIVGAGPAGLVMALCLAKRGVSSILIERQEAVNPHPKAHELNTRSLEILAELGLSESDLAKEASPESDGCRIAFCATINEEFGAIDLYKDIEDPGKYQRHLASKVPYLNISQTEIERLLHQQAKANTHVDLRLGHQWESMQQDDAYIECSVRDRQRDERYHVRSRWLIGADGAGSRIRKALGIPMLGPEKIQDFVNAYFELNLREHIERPAKLYWIAEPSAFGTFIAHHIEKRWVYNIPIYEPWESAQDYDKVTLAARIKTALDLKEGEVDVKSTSIWRMTVQVAERWRDGRTFLIGDAAHRFPPTGGLGMNSGIADAHNLAWKLAQVIDDISGLELLDSYEVERKPVAERNGKESLENFHRIFEVFERLGLPKNGAEQAVRLRKAKILTILPSALRDKLFQLADSIVRKKIARTTKDPEKLAAVRASIFDQIPHFDRIGLDLGYVYSSEAVLSVGEQPEETGVSHYRPSCEPGARFPHTWLYPDSQERSSHTLLDYSHWTLLTVGDTPPEHPLAPSNLDSGRVRHIAIDELEIPENGRKALLAICELTDYGFVLIRPDGHVALRIDQGNYPLERFASTKPDNAVSAKLMMFGLAEERSAQAAPSLAL
ncbi:MAG: FAD-dependent monooxygenase [Pseudomonadota bacterium]